MPNVVRFLDHMRSNYAWDRNLHLADAVIILLKEYNWTLFNPNEPRIYPGVVLPELSIRSSYFTPKGGRRSLFA